MKIERIKVGYLQANCYILTKDNKSIIIDPGAELEKILKHCKEKNIVGILITHHHFDHVGALEELEEHFKLNHNPDSIEGFHFQKISTPGHTDDSISFYFKEDNKLFTGDFIFYHNIGRCDLEGGNWKKMKESIKNFLKWETDPKIYPGHGDITTLKQEIPFLKMIIESNNSF